MGENETNTTTVATALAKMREVKKELTLKSGKKLTIYKGKGYDSVQALKDADNDGSLYLVTLMAKLVEIDGQQLVPEDLQNLDLDDFMQIQTEFANVNF